MTSASIARPSMSVGTASGVASGTKVQLTLGSGAQDVDYAIVAEILSSGGQVLKGRGILQVRQP